MLQTRIKLHVHYALLAITLCSACLLSSQILEAATYYVATTGNDSNIGTESMPFRTIGKGVTVLYPGDKLYVKNGTYPESFYGKIPGGSSWSSPVTIAAYPGHSVTLRPNPGPDVVLYFKGVNQQYIVVEGLILDAINVGNAIKITYGTWDGYASRIRIKNCEVKNARYSGILTSINSGNNEFIGLKVHDNGSRPQYDHGFYLTSSNNLIEGCTVFNNKTYGIQLYNSNRTVSNNIIRNNVIYDNAVGGDGYGIIITSGSGNKAYGNRVWGNRGGIKIDYASDTEISNNIVYSNNRGPSEAGVKIGSGGLGTVVKNNNVYNNFAGQITNFGFLTQLIGNVFGPPQ
jgi:parallel beta-helix repeat protein